jgi:hypothetical protein
MAFHFDTLGEGSLFQFVLMAVKRWRHLLSRHRQGKSVGDRPILEPTNYSDAFRINHARVTRGSMRLGRDGKSYLLGGEMAYACWTCTAV